MNPWLAILGGLTGEVEVDGDIFCVDPDGDCSGTPSYLEENIESLTKSSVIQATNSEFKFKGKSFRRNFPFIFANVVEAGAKTEASPPSRPAVKGVSRGGGFPTRDPFGVLGDSEYDCRVFASMPIAGEDDFEFLLCFWVGGPSASLNVTMQGGRVELNDIRGSVERLGFRSKTAAVVPGGKLKAKDAKVGVLGFAFPRYWDSHVCANHTAAKALQFESGSTRSHDPCGP